VLGEERDGPLHRQRPGGLEGVRLAVVGDQLGVRADGVSDAIIAAYGAPEASPEFWQDVSPVTDFDRITEPILIQHGTADESCPVAWSQQTLTALQAAGADAELITYDGEPHAFEAAWPVSMERTVAFFTEHLRA